MGASAETEEEVEAMQYIRDWDLGWVWLIRGKVFARYMTEEQEAQYYWRMLLETESRIAELQQMEDNELAKNIESIAEELIVYKLRAQMMPLFREYPDLPVGRRKQELAARVDSIWEIRCKELYQAFGHARGLQWPTTPKPFPCQHDAALENAALAGQVFYATTLWDIECCNIMQDLNLLSPADVQEHWNDVFAWLLRVTRKLYLLPCHKLATHVDILLDKRIPDIELAMGSIPNLTLPADVKRMNDCEEFERLLKSLHALLEEARILAPASRTARKLEKERRPKLRLKLVCSLIDNEKRLKSVQEMGRFKRAREDLRRYAEDGRSEFVV